MTWSGIEIWARNQPAEQNAEQQPLLDRLRQSLLFGTMVLGALEDDLMQLMTGP